MQRFKFGLGAAACIFMAISVFMVSRWQRAEVKKISDVAFISRPNVYPNGRFEGVILDPVDSNIKIAAGVISGDSLEVEHERKFAVPLGNAAHIAGTDLTFGIRPDVRGGPEMQLFDKNLAVIDTMKFEELESAAAFFFADKSFAVIYSHGIGLASDVFRVVKVDQSLPAPKLALTQSLRPNRSLGAWFLHPSQVKCSVANNWIAAVTQDGYPSIWRVTDEGISQVDTQQLVGATRASGDYWSKIDVSPNLRFVAVSTAVLCVDDGGDYPLDTYTLDLRIWNVQTKELVFQHDKIVPNNSARWTHSFVDDEQLLQVHGQEIQKLDFADRSNPHWSLVGRLSTTDVVDLVHSNGRTFPLLFHEDRRQFALGNSIDILPEQRD